MLHQLAPSKCADCLTNIALSDNKSIHFQFVKIATNLIITIIIAALLRTGVQKMTKNND